MKTTLLLTGASGFVGSHVLEHVLRFTDWDVICPVTQRHQGAVARLLDMECWQQHAGRVKIVKLDLSMPLSKHDAYHLLSGVRFVWHLAAESHVDRSIKDPVPFIQNNVAVTLNLLEAIRIGPWPITRFIQFSTDEVYGPAPTGVLHKEWSPIIPSNPYSASKACQEAIVISYWRTYRIPIVITNTMNVFGERQDPEKFIPMCIKAFTQAPKQPIEVHCAPDGTPGSRFWIHARNVGSALQYINSFNALCYNQNVPRPPRYNIVGEKEINNFDLARQIGILCGRISPDHDPESNGYLKRVSFHSSRPGHDLRYALDGTSLTRMGWEPPRTFEESLSTTIEWTRAHPEWLR